jgi:hypothetical protein
LHAPNLRSPCSGKVVLYVRPRAVFIERGESLIDPNTRSTGNMSLRRGSTREYGVGLGLALLVQADSRFNGAIRTLLFMPQTVSLVVVALVWQVPVIDKIGLFNQWIRGSECKRASSLTRRTRATSQSA